MGTMKAVATPASSLACAAGRAWEQWSPVAAKAAKPSMSGARLKACMAESSAQQRRPEKGVQALWRSTSKCAERQQCEAHGSGYMV